jgi:antitoxin (DNA-binding transcriptional repressor) of toxin-antitoxin stability system
MGAKNTSVAHASVGALTAQSGGGKLTQSVTCTKLGIAPAFCFFWIGILTLLVAISKVATSGGEIMKSVGIKEFKNKATQILKEVREQGTEFFITLNDEAIATLKPVTHKESMAVKRKNRERILAEFEALAVEVGELWTSEENAVEAISNDRSRWCQS